MPSTYITRPAASGGGGPRLELHDVGTSLGGATLFPAVIPGGSPGATTEGVEFSGPALTTQGTIAWLPTNRTLMASCPDGRARWLMEFYNYDGRHEPQVFAASDGSVILAGAGDIGLHRIDPDGHVLASRDLSGIDGYMLGYSDRCGVALRTGDPATMTTRSTTLFAGADFSAVRELPPDAVPTSDCGWWGAGPAPDFAYSRIRPDGSPKFVAPPQAASSFAPIELTDGSWLLIKRGSSDGVPGMTIVGDDGTVVFDTAFDPTQVGEVLTNGAYQLTPNGILYVTATSSFEAVQQIAAIEVGIGPTSTWAPTLSGGVPGNWARDGAAWHPAPAP
jgi:hypothetical protein